jgi:phenylalanyl-tRNA synthetase alpha chain
LSYFYKSKPRGIFMKVPTLSLDALRQALCLRDLSNPAEGRHAMQLILQDTINALESSWSVKTKIYRDSPIVSIEDNYDNLRYPKDGASREARYTRYVCQTALLRTQTSAMIPAALEAIADNLPEDILLACPGLVHRRDCIDCIHTGEPHQVDLWRVSKTKHLTSQDLLEMIAIIVETALPGYQWRAEPRVHPYTLEGLQVDAYCNGQWIEIFECGLAHPEILKENIPHVQGLSGLACGIGLERLLMLRKGIKDIRLFRSSDPRVAAQMNDLQPYKEVSSMPPVTRDLSLVIDASKTLEDLGDRVREALGADASIVECISVLSQTDYKDLPEAAITRLGIAEGQMNILIRIVLRALDRTLTKEECNRYRDQIYAALHEGSAYDWTAK